MLYRKLEAVAKELRERVAGMVGDGPAQHALKLIASEVDQLAVEAAVLQPEGDDNGEG